MGATRNVGVGHGDQSFPGTTFFLPSYAIWWSASWWSWSSCGCHGVSRICCSAEMTWLAVLTGAAGASGAASSSPHISVDGGCNIGDLIDKLFYFETRLEIAI
ncbi:PREDICTED: uncharacterized protein LOC105111346 [Populus euphratica]|uniref:Uncharacterized protein LOC105111346 n=1 Tax=Populus euphratica TaxID=75702 RepID=A0AAJ6T664_POPEU|nr:PREDICTED: uncharacterized protein LOC105111346 [Populus euphratica]